MAPREYVVLACTFTKSERIVTVSVKQIKQRKLNVKRDSMLPIYNQYNQKSVEKVKKHTSEKQVMF